MPIIVSNLADAGWVERLGQTGGTTVLDLTVRNLASAAPEEIPSSAVDGMVVVQ